MGGITKPVDKQRQAVPRPTNEMSCSFEFQRSHITSVTLMIPAEDKIKVANRPIQNKFLTEKY